MSQTSSSETPVTKLARFIVDKRKAFFLVFLAAVLFCGSSIDKVWSTMTSPLISPPKPRPDGG